MSDALSWATRPHQNQFLLEPQYQWQFWEATNGVDIVDHTRPIDGTIACACIDDVTPALSFDATLERVANHEMAPAGT